MVASLPPVVSAKAAKKLLIESQVICVDARGGTDAFDRYRAGHIAGARFVDLETDLSVKGPDASRGGRHPLPEPRRFGVLLGQLGITPSTHVLVYDDKSGANAAARFWWMLRAAGHGTAQLVDGGYQAMIAEGHAATTGDDPLPRSGPPYPVSDWKLPMANLSDVESAAASDTQLVIDVRESYRYRGESEPIDPVAGHIPGALNAPYLDNLEAEGRFLSPQTLRKRYESLLAGRPIQNVIIHCGSGVTACHTLVALELAGLEGARLYPGSWSEWCRSNKPIATGPTP